MGEWQGEVKLIIMASSAMAATVQWLDLDTSASSARTTTRVQPVSLEVSMLANLFGGRPLVNGCQGMRPAMPATKNQAKPAETKDTKPAEKKPETGKVPEAKKTERGEPSKPATTTKYTTDQTSANANGLPGILADLTPLMGPLQAEQLSQFMRNISAPQQNQEPEKKEAKEKQP